MSLIVFNLVGLISNCFTKNYEPFFFFIIIDFNVEKQRGGRCVLNQVKKMYGNNVKIEKG